MAAQLQTLINKRDSFELVRAKLATILLEETAAQQVLAHAAALDPNLWKLRVFTERSNPWAEFKDSDEPQTPIVNVWFENMPFAKAASNMVSRQKGVATFHLDCYGFGFAKGTDQGHTSAEVMASDEASRAVRLVRNILVSGFYVYLGFPQANTLPAGQEQIVRGRWPASMTAFQPAQDDRPVVRVNAIRLDLEVEVNEFSTEYVGETIETITAGFTRTGGGEWLSTTFGVDPELEP
jgi:hypothetical protein